MLARPALPTAAALQGVAGTRSYASHAGQIYAAARRAPKHGPTEGVVYRVPLVALPSE